MTVITRLYRGRQDVWRPRFVHRWVREEHEQAAYTPGKREELELSNETRYIRRDAEGHFTEDQVDKGESLSRDRQRKAQHEAPEGQGDRGDLDRNYA